MILEMGFVREVHEVAGDESGSVRSGPVQSSESSRMDQEEEKKRKGVDALPFYAVSFHCLYHHHAMPSRMKGIARYCRIEI